jgi:hypothetical protein
MYPGFPSFPGSVGTPSQRPPAPGQTRTRDVEPSPSLGGTGALSGLGSRQQAVPPDASALPRPTFVPLRANLPTGKGSREPDLVQQLEQAGVQGETLQALRNLLSGAKSLDRRNPDDLATLEHLASEAQTAVCMMLASHQPPSPKAGQAAADALMQGLQALPDGPKRADEATREFLRALELVPVPTRSQDLPAYGQYLEATGLAILTAANRVPPSELKIGLEGAMAQFSARMLSRIPLLQHGPVAPADRQRLMDSAANVNAAVLQAVETLRSDLRTPSLALLADQLPRLWCDVDGMSHRVGGEIPFVRAAMDLLASVARLPHQERGGPLAALARAGAATPQLASWPQLNDRMNGMLADLHTFGKTPAHPGTVLHQPVGDHVPQPYAPQANSYNYDQLLQMMQANMQMNTMNSMFNNNRFGPF